MKFARIYVLICLLTATCLPLGAQICNGTLGENIFTAGDFGTGGVNILPFNPGYAPGYLYTTQPPPNDGFYTITNDMTVWTTTFGWVTIQDNSSNPNGYMMVVNASFAPGLFYEEEVEGLCENTTYTFTADVFNLIRSGTNLIKPNLSFLIDGQVLFNTGDVPENEQWNTYGFNFTTLPGQTSVTLSLANNAPGGNGNDIALDNISFRPCGPLAEVLPEQISDVCENGQPLELVAQVLGSQYPSPHYQWQLSLDAGVTWWNIPGANSNTYTHSTLTGGTYYYRYLLANDPGNLGNSKCRVASEIKIVRVVPKEYSFNDTICEGNQLVFGGQPLTVAGMYIDSLESASGCDSLVRLDLHVLPDQGIQAVFGAVNPTCSYLDDGYVQVFQVDQAYAPVDIALDGQPLPLNQSSFELGAGLHTLSVVDRFGCRLDTSFNLLAPPLFEIDLGQNWDIVLGDSIELTPLTNAPVANYDWEPTGWTDCIVDCSPVMILPEFDSFFQLNATSDSGCVATDSVWIEVTPVRNSYIPSAFSPNGDGLNDIFAVVGNFPSVLAVEEFLVYDRWGGLVYQQKEIPINSAGGGWDGKQAGKPAPEGVYAYRIAVRYLDGAVIPFTGTVTLIR